MIWTQLPTALQDKHQWPFYNADQFPLLPNGNSAKPHSQATTWSSFQDDCKVLPQDFSEQCTAIRFVFTGADNVVGIHISVRLDSARLNQAPDPYTTSDEWNYSTWSRPKTDLENSVLITCCRNILTNNKQ